MRPPPPRFAVRAYIGVRIYPALALGITPGIVLMAEWAGEPGISPALLWLRLVISALVVVAGGALIAGLLIHLGSLASRTSRSWSRLEAEAVEYLRTR